MYKVLDEYTIKNDILPHLPKAKRGYVTKSNLAEVVNAILYKLKTGCQWEFLPVEGLFTDVVLSFQSVYHHFRKWSKNGDWQSCWIKLLSANKSTIDLSSVDLDGSHTTSIRGGEDVSYQKRKKRKTCNSIYLTDREGIPIAMSRTKAGNHNDLHQIKESMDEIFETMTCAQIPIDGLFLNADAGFDSRELREICQRKGVIANICFNYRNGESKDELLFDDQLYKERYSIERTNAWLDSFRTLLNRFDTTVASWESFNYIAFIVILLKKIKKNKKFK